MKAIVLDMYGVIVKQTGDDFVPYVQQTFPNLSAEEIYTPWFKADVGELTSLEVWDAIGFRGDLEKIEKEYLDTIELSDGFIDFIEKVKNKYKLAIISNDSSRWSKYLREKFDINKYFDVISISGDLKIQKPDERIFLYTIEKLGVNAEDCIYIDDRSGNLNAAKKVGMKPILLNTRNESYEGTSVNSFSELEKEMNSTKLSIIFDLDGTLWNSTGCACEIWNRVMEKHNDISFRVTKEKAEQLMGKTMEDIGKILFPELNADIRNEIVDEFGDEEVKYLTENGAVLYEGLEDTLNTLSQQYKLYIVSNCQDGYIPAFLHAHKLERYFTDIEMSGRTGLDKGNNIKLIMKRNNIKSAVYIGDTDGDEKSARFAGIPFIYAKYGFGEALSPDAIITNIGELPDCIKKFDL